MTQCTKDSTDSTVGQKSGLRDFRYFSLVSETVVIFLIGWEMEEEIDFENHHLWNFKSHVTLTLTLDDLETHIIVNVSSTLTNTTIWFVATLNLIVDEWTSKCTYGHTYGRTDIFRGSIRSSLRRWPKNVKKSHKCKTELQDNVTFHH